MKRTMNFLVMLLFLSSGLEAAFAAEFNFTPRAGVNQEYTTNVFLTDKNKKDDYITTFAFGAAVEARGKSSGLEAAYDPAYVRYDQFDENDTWRHAARLRGWTAPSKRTRLEVRDNFLSSEDPLTLDEYLLVSGKRPLLEADTSTRRRGRRYYRNTATGEASYRFGREDVLSAGYTHRLLYDNDNTVEDRWSHNPYAALTYWMNARWGIQSRAAYTRFYYDQDTDDFNNYNGMLKLVHRFTRTFEGFLEYDHTYRDYDGDTPDYHVYQPAAGLTYNPTRTSTLSLRAGYFFQDRDEGGNSTGFSGDADFTRTWSRATLNLGASSGFNAGDYSSEATGNEQFYSARVRATYQFARRLSGDVAAFWRRTDFLDVKGGREDDRYQARAGLNFGLLPWLALRLQYTYNQVASDLRSERYLEHRGFVGFTLSPERPWRWMD